MDAFNYDMSDEMVTFDIIVGEFVRVLNKGEISFGKGEKYFYISVKEINVDVIREVFLYRTGNLNTSTRIFTLGESWY